MKELLLVYNKSRRKFEIYCCYIIIYFFILMDIFLYIYFVKFLISIVSLVINIIFGWFFCLRENFDFFEF